MESVFSNLYYFNKTTEMVKWMIRLPRVAGSSELKLLIGQAVGRCLNGSTSMAVFYRNLKPFS